MKKKKTTIRQILTTAGVILMGTLFAASAWAAVSYMSLDPEPQTPSVHMVSVENISTSIPEGPRGRAPEPSTLVLFSSGIFGMIVSFVRKTYEATKRVLDFLAGIVGLVVLSPLFLMTAILIKLTSKGPIFFKQERVGKNGQIFSIYKFRTMHVDAEKETGPVWAQANDNRLIPCGKFLRKAHIDEIPQFVNILKGEMSLIGPRPERPVFVDKFKREIADYEKRLAVKPGLTGLAQVWHKYDETLADVKKKIKYDLLYIKKVCLWTDLRILLRTFRVVVTGEGVR